MSGWSTGTWLLWTEEMIICGNRLENTNNRNGERSPSAAEWPPSTDEIG